MDRKEPTFTLDVLGNVLASAKARNFELKHVNLFPAQYTQLGNDIREKIGAELPPANSNIPVIVLGVQLVVWAPTSNGQTDT